MDRGNVLVIGNSGVGKSTLINAVLGEEKAKTGWGTKGTTEHLEIYESEEIAFRIIDSVGFEPSFIKRRKAINAVKKWSKDCAKGKKGNSSINMIWFCIDGGAAKLFPETIKNLLSAISIWKSIPIIVVITKSYAVPERELNIAMVNDAFAKEKRCLDNLKGIIPVVAATFVLNDSLYIPPEGITELIDTTNALMPEGIKAAESDIYNFKLKRKRVLAQSVVGASTTAGVVVGAVPVPIADALILSPIEVAQINALAQIYGIRKSEQTKQFLDSIVEVGTVSATAKMAISGLKAIPGINIGASLINAVIAGSFVVAIGEGTIYAFEQVYLGKKTLEDIDWIKKVIESKLSTEFIKKVTTLLEQVTESTDKKIIGKMVLDVFNTKK